MLATELKSGNMAGVYAEVARHAEERVKFMDEKRGPFSAEIMPDCSPQWHIIVTSPGHERIAAGHLIGRGFGVYIPEAEVQRKHRVKGIAKSLALMFPRYIFIFVWDVERHARRIKACPGVVDFLLIGDRIAAVPDALIDQIRAVENSKRPVMIPIEDVVLPRKRARRSRKRPKEVQLDPDDIICVHSYSPFIEAMRLAPEERIGALHKALGLSS